MLKRFCIFCEAVTGNIKNAYYWIHKKCFDSLNSNADNFIHVEKMIMEHKSIEEIKDFIKRSKEFDSKMDKARDLIESINN